MTGFELPEASDYLEYVFNVIKKEVRGEDRLIRQLVYTGLSAYTTNPSNLAINAPSGEGKTHAIAHTIIDLFPSKDVLVLTGTSQKFIFHKEGRLVIDTGKNGRDRYKDVTEQVESLIDEMAELKDSEKEQYKLKIKRAELKELEKNVKKLIDLNHKILVFLDSPPKELFEALMPLLSHDSYYSEYVYVDTHHGIKTKTNILCGYPAVIFAAAIDYSEWKRWPEVQRRFIITNPKMEISKYQEAILLAGKRHALPGLLYEQQVVSDKEKEYARQCISYLKDQILSISNSYQVKQAMSYNPFYTAVACSLQVEARKATMMSTADRILGWIELLPVIRYEKRPRVRVGNKLYPIALFEDLAEAMKLMEYSNGLRPYVIEWYNEVFLLTYLAKNDVDRKKMSNGEEREEDRIAVTSRELAEATKQLKQKSCTVKQIYETFLAPLHNEGYIDYEKSQIDNRQYIYYPVLGTKVYKLFGNDKSTNFSYRYRIPVSNPFIFPSKMILGFQFLSDLRNSSARPDLSDISFDHQGNSASLGKILSYYTRADEYFELLKYSNNLEKAVETKQHVDSNIVPESTKLHEKADSTNFFNFDVLALKKFEAIVSALQKFTTEQLVSECHKSGIEISLEQARHHLNLLNAEGRVFPDSADKWRFLA